MKRYYIAYGSNLNVPQMERRCPGAEIVGTAQLKGWELLFKGSKTGSYLTIEEAEGGKVPVAVWEVTPEDEAALDRYEGCPRFYYKRDLTVRCREIRSGRIRRLNAFVYIMHEDRPLGIPTDFYLNVCREGYETFGFNQRILTRAYEKCRKEVEDLEEKRHSDFWKGFRVV